MTLRHLVISLSAAGAAAFAGAAAATAISPETRLPPGGAPVAGSAPAPGNAQAALAPALQSGVVAGVRSDSMTFIVAGQAIELGPTARVFGPNGRQLDRSTGALRVGARVRFALAPASDAARAPRSTSAAGSAAPPPARQATIVYIDD